MATRLHCRWMIRRDMPAVLDIEQRSFPSPWSNDDFMDCLRRRNTIGMVAERSPYEVVGFMIYELSKYRLTLVNFAVHPAVRRSGVGRLMVEKLVGKLSSHRRAILSTVVSDSNLDGQLFFKANGLEAVRVLRGRFEGGTEDGYEMQFRLPGEVTDCLTNRVEQYEQS